MNMWNGNSGKPASGMHSACRQQRTGLDPTELGNDMIAYATSRGIDRFKVEMARQRAAARDYRSQLRRGTYASIGMSFLEDMSDDDGFPDPVWYYYH